MRRKGFPESYDLPRMLRFLSAVKAAERDLELPVYSHLIGDIMPSERQVVRQPDILVFEGLNVLHARGTAPVVVSDFFDFSIYLDADEADIQSWYVERFLGLQRTAFRDPASYFHHYRDLPPRDAREVADRLWREHHRANLREAAVVDARAREIQIAQLFEILQMSEARTLHQRSGQSKIPELA